MASTVPDRGTKINMDLVPTIEAIQQILYTSTLVTHLRGSTKLQEEEGISLQDVPCYETFRWSQSLVPTDEATVDITDTIWESPWDYFQQVYELSLGGFVIIVSERAAPYDLFIMKHFQGADEIRMLRSLSHRNLHQMLECLGFEDSYFAIFGYDPVSLAHIACSPPFLTEFQLSAIVGQILDGLAYLAANGLEPGPFKCSNILLDADGTVKITSHESCKKITSSTEDMKALGYVTMELMQKYPNSSGSIGLQDFDHWPSDGNAVGFLAMTTSATSLEQLLSHLLLDCDWRDEDLKWIVALSAVTTYRGWRYK